MVHLDLLLNLNDVNQDIDRAFCVVLGLAVSAGRVRLWSVHQKQHSQDGNTQYYSLSRLAIRKNLLLAC